MKTAALNVSDLSADPANLRQHDERSIAAIMSKAKLVFKMEGERRARPVTIIPPITVVFEHDELGDIIEQFLLDRHLMLPRTESLRASPESLFAMS